MKTRSNYLVFASLFLVLMLVSLASATMTVTNPTSFSNSTLPSDDSNSRTLSFTFNVTNLNTSSNTIINLGTSGLSAWSPSLSKTSDTIAPNATNTYTLQLTAPKYSSSPTSGFLDITETGSVSIITSLPISLSLNAHNSLSLSSPNPSTLSKSRNTTQLILKNDGNTVINNIVLSLDNSSKIIDIDGNEIGLALTSNKSGVVIGQSFSLNSQESVKLNISHTTEFEDLDNVDLLLGESFTFLRVASPVFNVSSQIKFDNEYCDFGELGNEVRIKGVSDESSDSDNFNWNLLDEVQVDVDVENNGNSDDDITVELILYDSKNGNDLYSAEQTIEVNEDDEETFSFNFIVPADTPDNNARLYIKAYSNEDEQCSSSWGSSKFERVSIDSKDDYDVGFTDLEIESTLMCGETTSFEAKIHNIGDKDQKKVLVSLTSTGLKVDQDLLIDNLDAGDSESISFPIQIPSNSEEKLYQFELSARHNYKKGSDSYSDLSDKVLKSITVKGNCVVGQPIGQLTISPSLDSEAKAGSDLIVRTIIKNTGKDFAQVSVIPFGYEAWAKLKSVEPSTITLNSGESREVKIILTPNTDTSGDQRFTIRASYGAKLSDQEVSVFVQQKSNFFSSIGDSIKENWVIWVIVIANIILILAIIIAAVKLSKN